jgi:hypothetical protein
MRRIDRDKRGTQLDGRGTRETRIYPLAVFEGCRYISRLDTYRERTGEHEKGKPKLVG